MADSTETPTMSNNLIVHILEGFFVFWMKVIIGIMAIFAVFLSIILLSEFASYIWQKSAIFTELVF